MAAAFVDACYLLKKNTRMEMLPMKKRVFCKKKIGALALALLVTPLVGVPLAQADNIFIEGGGGGGGAGNDGTMAAGGGGNGATIDTAAHNDAAGTGEDAGSSAGGSGGTGGNADANRDGANGGVGGGGNNAVYVDSTSGTVDNGADHSGGNGGAGGNAAATATDMTGVGAGDNVSIHGGNGGQGGAGYDTYDGSDPGTRGGDIGGAGGAGGNASLDWGAGNQAIGSLDVKAGATGGRQFGWSELRDDGQGPYLYEHYSAGGQGGSASFFLDGDLTTTGTVNVQADGNFASYESGSLTAGGATTVTATDYEATMLVHGNADLTSLAVVSGGSGLASFTADGTGIVTTSGTIDVRANSSGNATYESNDLTAGDATTVQTSGAGSATMTVHGNADLTTLDVLSSNSGNAGFTADGTGIVTTSGDVSVQATTGTGNATFDSEQYFGGGTTQILSTGPGDASMTVSAASNSVSSVGTMTIEATGSGNASFFAPIAGTVRITGPDEDLVVRTSGSGGGQASFDAPYATVSVASGNLTIDSSGTTDPGGTATFNSRGLNMTGNATVQSGAAAASATVTGTTFVTVGDLTVKADEGTASFTANNTDKFSANTIFVGAGGSGAGDAKIEALSGTIDTSNHDVTIDTTGGTGGTKGIYANRLETGNEQVLQENNGIVTMIGSSGSKAELVLTDSLQTRELNLTGIAGDQNAVVTNINKVDVTVIDTTFNFTDTVASTDSGQSGVYFKTISLGDATAVRTLTANADLGTYWADNLDVNVTNTPGAGQNWVGNIWLGGSPGVYGVTSATGTVGTVNMILPASVNLLDYRGSGNGVNPNYMLAVDGNVTVSDGAQFSLKAAQGTNPFTALSKGDQLQLLHSSGITDDTTKGIQVVGSAGATDYLFDLGVAANGQDLLARYGWADESVAKAYLEGNVAALGNLNQGSELISRTLRNTFDPNVQGDLFKDKNGYGLGVMFGAEYAHQRLYAGSHVSSDYYNFVVGPALKTETGIGRLGLSVFFETGHGDYSTHNAFTFSNVVGNGNTDYFGGGIALRNDFVHGIYADFSLRAGSVTTDLNLRDRFGARYDQNTTYMGGHANVGKIFDFAKDGRLDIYGGMLWTRLNGFNATTGAGERVEFDAVDSLRSQIGGRYSYDFCKMASGYVGGAWEYEFDGDVGGTLNGARIDEPSLGGSTGKGEVGVSITPAKNFSIDLGLQGYTGQREGVGGTGTLTYTF